MGLAERLLPRRLCRPEEIEAMLRPPLQALSLALREHGLAGIRGRVEHDGESAICTDLEAIDMRGDNRPVPATPIRGSFPIVTPLDPGDPSGLLQFPSGADTRDPPMAEAARRGLIATALAFQARNDQGALAMEVFIPVTGEPVLQACDTCSGNAKHLQNRHEPEPDTAPSP